jgi:hypothetical protein
MIAREMVQRIWRKMHSPGLSGNRTKALEEFCSGSVAVSPKPGWKQLPKIGQNGRIFWGGRSQAASFYRF